MKDIIQQIMNQENLDEIYGYLISSTLLPSIRFK